MIMKRLLCLSKILIILIKQSNSSVITNSLQLYHSRVSVSLNPNNVHATIQFKHSSKQYHKICHQLWITKDFIKLVMGLGYKKSVFFFWIQRALRIREHTSFSFASIIHSLSLSLFLRHGEIFLLTLGLYFFFSFMFFNTWFSLFLFFSWCQFFFFTYTHHFNHFSKSLSNFFFLLTYFSPTLNFSQPLFELQLLSYP
jgi:hypothetical protein